MGLEVAAWTAAIASLAGAGASAYQGNQQLKQAEKEYDANLQAQKEADMKADEAEIARKRALVAQEESMSASSDTKKKKKNTFAGQAGDFNATGSGFGLGTSNGKLGG